MAFPPLNRAISVATNLTPLSLTPQAGNFTLRAAASNSGAVEFEGDDGSKPLLQPGEAVYYGKVDMNSIKVKGTAGDVINVFGNK